MSFDDWYKVPLDGYDDYDCYYDKDDLEKAFNAGRAEQREADAVWLESKNYELLGTDLAKALRKQEIE